MAPDLLIHTWVRNFELLFGSNWTLCPIKPTLAIAWNGIDSNKGLGSYRLTEEVKRQLEVNDDWKVYHGQERLWILTSTNPKILTRIMLRRPWEYTIESKDSDKGDMNWTKEYPCICRGNIVVDKVHLYKKFTNPLTAKLREMNTWSSSVPKVNPQTRPLPIPNFIPTKCNTTSPANSALAWLTSTISAAAVRRYHERSCVTRLSPKNPWLPK